MTEASAVLARLGSVGPYFTVQYGERQDPEGFGPLSGLYGTDSADTINAPGTVPDGDGDGPAGPLSAYVRLYARRMGTDQLRVAASAFQLGLASRLWSVALGAAVLAGRLPDLNPERLRVRLTDDGPLELWLPVPALAPQGPQEDHPADAVLAAVALAHLRPFHATLRARYSLSPHTLRGNAASALAGAVRVLNGRRPGVEARATALAAAVLAGEPLAGSGDFIVEEGLGFAFLRNNCCLYYRVPGGSLCGDCVLRHPRNGRPAAR
ncbi:MULTISPECIES: (2Fe-2S)-binding protein [unclassified Streptomyces]|uniref:(2Fe-2S)-binding protein n=1 Tax=unclassified Streptomyces TaxID=2593676 RepID=UPI002E11F88C|nr:(2Fe-2S)-binding protein [Streptomyces sp. NBC_01197]WSS48693.1 (2Fe-2S)-binding protein [Streptomyces sp. NBC_01180]